MFQKHQKNYPILLKKQQIMNVRNIVRDILYLTDFSILASIKWEIKTLIASIRLIHREI